MSVPYVQNCTVAASPLKFNELRQ